MTKQDSESDINIDYTQDELNSHTPETLQIHNTYNTTMHDKDDLIHDEYDTSEDKNITEIETFEHYGEKIHETKESIPTETSQVLTVSNKTIHHEDDSSDDKSVIEIEPPKENGEQKIGKQDKLLTTKFQMEIENRKAATMAQFFCGRDTLVCDAYGIKSTKQFINTLSDNIRKGEPWTPSSVMEANMKSPSESLTSPFPVHSRLYVRT